MEDDEPLLSIGELGKRTGLPVRTIRFWSDAGVLPPAGRTGSGRRVYDTACVARLELVVTLRELGLGLPDMRRVLDGRVGIAEVAAVHLQALDAQIRALRLHRAVLAVVVKRAAGKEEMTLMNKLARMSVAERRQMIDEFLAEVFEGIDAARAPRWGAAWNLPDDPSPEQVDAWVELAELVSDPDFRQRIRQVMDIGRQVDARDGLPDFLDWVHENAVAAGLRGCPPDSGEAAQVLNRILEPAPGEHPVDREELIAGLEVTTDPRIERYWQLTATINGWPPFSSHMPGDLWLLWHGSFKTTPGRIVLVRDPGSPKPYELGLFTLDTSADPAAIAERYSWRWPIEPSNATGKQTPGVGDAFNRVARAVERTVPFGFLVQSLLICWYARCARDPADIERRCRLCPWYRTKTAPSAADMLARLRREFLDARFSAIRPGQDASDQIDLAFWTCGGIAA